MRQVQVWPVRTNAAFLARCAADPDFAAGHIDTGFIDRHADRLIPDGTPPENVVRAAAAALLPAPRRHALGPTSRASAPNADRAFTVAVTIDGQSHVAFGDGLPAERPRMADVDGTRLLFRDGEAVTISDRVPSPGAAGATASDGAIVAPMPGRIVSVDVAEGHHGHDRPETARAGGDEDGAGARRTVRRHYGRAHCFGGCAGGGGDGAGAGGAAVGMIPLPFVSSEVETRFAPARKRPSTSLGTNGKAGVVILHLRDAALADLPTVMALIADDETARAPRRPLRFRSIPATPPPSTRSTPIPTSI